MQAAQLSAIFPPQLLGLGLQVHRQFGTRFLVDVLNKFGFCFSYSEVQKYERNAAFHPSIDIRGIISLDHSWQHPDQVPQWPCNFAPRI